ncbi:MAG: response regulator [Methylovulum sp.]|nr:response regulator [Methylovulum sp.]
MNIQPCVFIVDDDYAVRDGLGLVLETAGFTCQAFESAEHFLHAYCPAQIGCLLLDVNMPGLSGFELQAELIRLDMRLPIIFLTAYGDIPMSVRAIKAGAVDFLTKPVPAQLLIERIQAALQQEVQRREQLLAEQAAYRRINDLTPREMEVMSLVVASYSNKEIARQLGISYRTIEVHRSRIMSKTGAPNLLELAQLYEACGLTPESKLK